MKKNLKIIKIPLILLIILIALVLILSICIEIKKKEYKNTKPSDYNEVMEDIKILKFKNSEVLKDLKGELPVSTVTSKLKKIFCEDIPKTIKNTTTFSDEKVVAYYNKNKENILTNIRIKNEDSFLNMIKEFKDIGVDLEKEYDYIEFNKDEVINCKIVYTNGEKVEFRITGDYANAIYLEF